MKAEDLGRQTLRLTVLQLQNDIALLRYLLLSDKDIAVKNSATNPLINPNPNPNPNSTSSAFPLSCTEEPRLRRSTPMGAVGPPRAKTNNSANADSQALSNTREAPPTTVQNLTSRVSRLEKVYTHEIATYTAITVEIHSQYFSLYDKIRLLEARNSDVIIWEIPSVKFVLDSAKVARPSSDPLIEPARRFSSPVFRTHRHRCNFFIKF